MYVLLSINGIINNICDYTYVYVDGCGGVYYIYRFKTTNGLLTIIDELE